MSKGGREGCGERDARCGAFRRTTALAAPAQRAGLVTAVFAVGYLAFSVPALIAGVATTKYGLHNTALVYSASLTALVVAAAGILIFRPGGQPAGQGRKLTRPVGHPWSPRSAPVTTPASSLVQ